MIDAGYLFEGVGVPLGRFEFASGTLTRPVAAGIRKPPASQNPLYRHDLAVPRESVPRHRSWPNCRCRCPSITCSASTSRRSRPTEFPIDCVGPIRPFRRATLSWPGRRLARPMRASAGTRSTSTVSCGTGWWYYYICTSLYKVPEGPGSWCCSRCVLLVIQRRTREAWADEICLWTVPVVVLFSMSFLTDINLGLRYVLSIAPYVFIAAGKVVPWVEGAPRAAALDRTARSSLASLGLTIAAALLDSPALPGLLQLGFGRAGSRAGSADRQQSRLGPGPGRPARVVPRAHRRGNRSAWLTSARSTPRYLHAQPADSFDWFLPPVKPGRPCSCQ